MASLTAAGGTGSVRPGAVGPRKLPRPTPAELAAAADLLLPDLIGPDLDVLFCGINPGLYSAATARHFARPGNRFWPALHRGGFTPHLVDPADQAELLGYGLGITNLADRASARADELTRDELAEGGRRLVDKIRRHRPRWVAVLGITAYRIAFDRRTALLGRQDGTLGGAEVWVLPNPSGLNAHFTPDALAAEFAALRAAVGGPVSRRRSPRSRPANR
ncbi:G/U mismatch-specific DNA glycosylase [Plantactinospora soyae]|uniref:TDG/mug DNA glycosylase family protein n=1 Tax=Plantactinospora soyae TaxID=1544732 RepID=A0A927MFI4_9ACTN|nr:G/U mismatch-specific DNA glycosylase [Plantactinospora soyae]MBE1492116.1 TDG/mug DNA glycosylase family protein [Plantactinospora soyae]